MNISDKEGVIPDDHALLRQMEFNAGNLLIDIAAAQAQGGPHLMYEEAKKLVQNAVSLVTMATEIGHRRKEMNREIQRLKGTKQT